MPKIEKIEEINAMITEMMPQSWISSELYCPEIELKIKSLLWNIHFYEETVLYGMIPRIYDPKGVLLSSFDRITTNQNCQFYLFKIYENYTKELRSEI